MLIRLKAFCVGALLLHSTLPGLAQPATYDLVLRNARIVDGSGRPAYRGDVAISGDTIASIAPAITADTRRVIDVGGQALAPGFIDVHNHARTRRGIFQHPTADNFVRQGITTVVEGPDGSSPVPLAPFLRQLAALPKSLNIGAFIGQGSVRTAVLGRVNRPASAEEIDKMRALVEQGMRDGAFGLSSGLEYVPGTYAPLEEIVELAKAAGRLGGHYQSHVRGEGTSVVTAVREAIAVGERGGLPVQITHHKMVGRGAWGKSVETLRLVDQARARGLDVTIDQYPYTSGHLSNQLPAWALEGSREDALNRLKNPDQRARIKADIVRRLRVGGAGGDLTKIVILHCPWDASLDGKNLADVARLRGHKANPEEASEAVLWLFEQGDCERMQRDVMNEADVERILRHPATMIASDGEIPPGLGDPHASPTHPRDYGAFVRVLAVYVRERKVIKLEEAVRKMSALPAQRLGLRDRGSIRPGMKADLMVFDPARVRDAATFDKPHQYADGVPLVIVNGQVVFEAGAMTAARPGQVLFGPAKQ
jgi:N-acyl-D-amino-acid deacylase